MHRRVFTFNRERPQDKSARYRIQLPAAGVLPARSSRVCLLFDNSQCTYRQARTRREQTKDIESTPTPCPHIGGEHGLHRLVTPAARICRSFAFLASSDRLVLQEVDTPPRYEVIVEVEAVHEDAGR